MKRRINIAAKLVMAAGMIAGTPSVALAQTSSGDDGGGLEDIVVTATRRSENVQDIPLSITAVSGDTLRNRGITDPRQLSGLAPSLNIDQGLGNGQTHISIRGQASTSFGLSSNSPAGIYVDDVFQVSQFGVATQMYDLGRIEVLRGPQGTLFGRNTTAGALSYFSQTPVMRDEGYFLVDAGGGDFNRYAAEGAFNKALGKDLAIRASFRSERRNAYISNLFDGQKLGAYSSISGRLQLQWKPSTDTTVNLKVFGLNNDGDSPVYMSRGYFFNPCDIPDIPPVYGCIGGTPRALPSSSRTADTPIRGYEKFDNYGATLRIDHAFGDYSLTSVSNVQEGHYALVGNDDGLHDDFYHSAQVGKTRQLSQELRLATPSAAPLSAIVGLFGQHSTYKGDESTISGLLEYTNNTVSDDISTSLAAFTSVTYKVSDQLSFIGGLRYTRETVKNGGLILNLANIPGDPPRPITDAFLTTPYALAVYRAGPYPADSLTLTPGEDTYEKLTWDATVNFKPSDDALIYAKAGTGFKSGMLAPSPAGSALPVVSLRPETVMSYEGGLKTEWLDHKLRLNGAVYYTDYRNLQVQTANSTGSGLGFSNAGAARIKGAELELEVLPTRGLNLSGSIGYTDATYKTYQTLIGGLPTSLAGRSLPFAPKWTANLGANYEARTGSDTKIVLNTNWNYRSKIFFDSANTVEIEDPERFIGNASIGFGAADDSWQILAYVNNVLDEDMVAFSYELIAAAPTIYAPKRTFGAQAMFRF